MHIKKHPGFSGLRNILSKRFSRVSDHREKEQVEYRMHDVFMSGLAMTCFRDRSLLEFQRRLRSSRHGNSLATMFHVRSIPEETRMRDTMDEVDSSLNPPLMAGSISAPRRSSAPPV